MIKKNSTQYAELMKENESLTLFNKKINKDLNKQEKTINKMQHN